MGVSYDINSEKWLSIFKLNSLSNPQYYEDMRKYFNSLCMGMGHLDLIEELNALIRTTIEEPMGSDWNVILFTYRNLPALNSFTKSRNPDYPVEYVRKYEIKIWLDKIESWIFQKLVGMETDIRFQERQTIM